MQDIRVLVADDEIPARGELKYELATIPGVQIVGECKNGKEVLDFLNVHPNVDILFLDIEMPFMNGLECAKEIQRRDYPVKIVFATGYSQFAVQAFDLEAFDRKIRPLPLLHHQRHHRIQDGPKRRRTAPRAPRLLPHPQRLHRKPCHDPGTRKPGQRHPPPHHELLPQGKSSGIQTLHQRLQKHAAYILKKYRKGNPSGRKPEGFLD